MLRLVFLHYSETCSATKALLNMWVKENPAYQLLEGSSQMNQRHAGLCLTVAGPFRNVQLYSAVTQDTFAALWGLPALARIFCFFTFGIILNISVFTLAPPIMCAEVRNGCQVGPCIINQLACGCENNILNVIRAYSCILSLATDVWCPVQ